MTSIRKLIIAAFSAGLLTLPAIAALGGVRAGSPENRASAPAPQLSDGWDILKKLGFYVNDRLPLRKEAVRIDALIDEKVFSEDPTFGVTANPRVILGKNGFLFLADAIDNACTPNLEPRESSRHLARLAEQISKSGREVRILVAPDKSTIHPQLLPDGLLKRQCFDQQRELLWASLNEAEIEGYIDLRRVLLNKSTITRQPLYLRKDSHWDSVGSLAAVEKIISSFDEKLWARAAIKNAGKITYQGDLTGLRGLPESDEAPQIEVLLPDSQVVSDQQLNEFTFAENRRVIRKSELPLITGRTLFLLDSFGIAALPQVKPFFEDLTTVRLTDFDAEEFVRLINDSDNVIIMSVERSLGYRMLAEVGSDNFIEELTKSMKGKNR